MPRLSHSILRQAKALDPLLPLLLRTCRDLHIARNELRWLREHVGRQSSAESAGLSHLRRLCLERARGKPLQYILGTQPFGNLEILCRPGVLIPRYATEIYTTHLATIFRNQWHPSRNSSRRGLRILDLCTGTGCIPLLLQSLLFKHVLNLQIRGVDISHCALNLAEDNLKHNISESYLPNLARQQVEFVYGDVLKDDSLGHEGWDIVISNPPYISPSSFNKDTERSVRNYEPKLALVPEVPVEQALDGTDLTGDVFYKHILDIADRANASIVVMEVADAAQAQRVVAMASHNWPHRQTWHEDLHDQLIKNHSSCIENTAKELHLGTGNARAVVLYRQG